LIGRWIQGRKGELMALSLDSWAKGGPLPSVADLLRRNAEAAETRSKPMLLFEELGWTYDEYFRECCRFGNLFKARLPSTRPRHIGIVAENTPDYLFALGGAALSECGVVTLNLTRRGEHLQRDLRHTDVGILIVQAEFAHLLEAVWGTLGLTPERVLVTSRFSSDAPRPLLPTAEYEDLDSALVSMAADDPGGHPRAGDTLILTFTSGTTGAPKAIPWSHERVVGTSATLAEIVGLASADIAYMAMPLFHANSLVCNWGPVLATGATTAMVRRFSASRWLSDIRRFGATYANYVGKSITYVLATPEQPDDADNPLRIMFGNEGASPRLGQFAGRFGVNLFESYGTSEGGISILRDEKTPPYALGPVPPGVKVVDEEGNELAAAHLDQHGRVSNPEECVGLLVQTQPVGAFSGYYKNDEATRDYTRGGWLWTGDLAYIDANGFVYFAGRGEEWIRVDGENLLGAPIEELIARHPGVIMASAYGVPDPDSGDQVMACIAVEDPDDFDVNEFSDWMRAQVDLSPKWRPGFLRVARDLPLNGSNKVLKRLLMTEKFRLDRVTGDRVYIWGRNAEHPVAFSAAEQDALHERFVASGRERFWDL
jgi:fatty-acyl-CoA synthase